MAEPISRIDQLGSATITPSKVLLIEGQPHSGVIFFNRGLTSFYLKMLPSGTAAGNVTISSTDNHFEVMAGRKVPLSVGNQIDIWAIAPDGNVACDFIRCNGDPAAIGDALAGGAVTSVPPTTAYGPSTSTLFSTDDLGTKTVNVAKAAPGTLISLMATNLHATMRWLLLFNKTTVPAPGDLPENWGIFPLGFGETDAPFILVIDSTLLGAGGKYFDTGLSWAISSTPNVYTATGVVTSDHQVKVGYV